MRCKQHLINVRSKTTDLTRELIALQAAVTYRRAQTTAERRVWSTDEDN